MICRKATVALPDANFFSFYAALPSSRAQNRVFCAFWGLGTPIFGHFEHKIGVFVLFWPPKPSFSGVSSTKSMFLCAFALQNPHFRAFRAQNRGFCALLPFETHVFGHFEHKISIVVLRRKKSGIGKRNHGDAFASFFPMVVPNGLLPSRLSALPYQHSVSFSISGMSEAWYSGSFPALS